MGELSVKNIARPVRVYALRRGALFKPPVPTAANVRKWHIWAG
jgi:class 3 adenylate cyclase